MDKELTKAERWELLKKVGMNMYRAGIEMPEIIKILGITKEEAKEHFEIEVKSLDSRRHAMIVNKAYERAIRGDPDMIKLILKSHCNWNDKQEVKVSGEVGLRPILNISLGDKTT